MLLDEASPEMKVQREERLARMSKLLEKEQDRVYVVAAQDGSRKGGLRKRKNNGLKKRTDDATNS